jgi:hypothetical protein
MNTRRAGATDQERELFDKFLRLTRQADAMRAQLAALDRQIDETLRAYLDTAGSQATNRGEQ